MTWAIVSIMLGLLLLGFPMMVPLLVATLVGFVFFLGMDPQLMIQQMIGGVKPAALIAVPMFILAADIITKGHAADRLLDMVVKFVGHLRGGLAITTTASCALFGAVSGSTQATVVAIGGPLRPRMLKYGYSDAFTMGLIINASDLALLIPPSIGMIIYGVVSGSSIGELFIAGIGPGLVLLVMFSAYAAFAAWRMGIPLLPKEPWSERLTAVRRALLPLGFPVIVIGGIYTGIFSPTEAASISVMYALIIEVVIFRSVKLTDLPAIALSTGVITAVVFILVGAGAAFSWMISFAQIPQQLIGSMGLDDVGPTHLLIVLSIAFFIGCMFVDPIVVILILVPIFAPLTAKAGIDPILVGTIVTLQAAIGSATPPFGCDIFTAVAVFKRPYLEVIRGTPPFIFILFIMSGLLIAFPQIALFLRDLAFR